MPGDLDGTDLVDEMAARTNHADILRIIQYSRALHRGAATHGALWHEFNERRGD
jgi:hypothetical protein